MRPASGLALVATALAASAVVLTLPVTDGEWHFAAGFGLALAWRLALGRDGRALLPRRALGVFLALLLAVALPFLLDLAGEASGPEFFRGVMATLTCFLGLALLAPLATFGCFWIVLLSSTAAAVACSLAGEPLTAVLLLAHVALLACTLLALERAASAAEVPAGRRLVDPGSRAGRALRGAALRLASTGVVLGALLWLAAPRPGDGAGRERDERLLGSASAEALGDRAAVPRGGSAGDAAPSLGDDAVLGAVDRIQQDQRAHLEVRLLQGSESPTLLLREAVRDLWIDLPGSRAARWRSSRSLESGTLAPEPDGWTVLGDPAPGRAERTLEARMRLGSTLLFVEPDALAFRVERPLGDSPDGPREPVEGLTRRLGSTRLERHLRAGDVVVMRSQPQPRGGAALDRRESSARVSPLTAYASIEPGLAERLRDLSEDVPGLAGGDAWRRARALELWLQGPAFVYELASPALPAGRRVEEFLGRVRRGNCEWYATALTLLLRAHGHAARYVQGYWGGSHTPGSGLWTFHGTSYHAWTELYLDGVGWVPLNPTPPERLEALGDPRTAESARSGAKGPGAAAAAPLSERLRGWAAGALDWLGRGARAPGAGHLALLALALALALAFVLRGRRRARAERAAGGAPPAPATSLAEALRLLARRGFARPAHWTAREYLERTGATLRDEAGVVLARLTERHEQRFYGGRALPGDQDRADLALLATALAPRTRS